MGSIAKNSDLIVNSHYLFFAVLNWRKYEMETRLAGERAKTKGAESFQGTKRSNFRNIESRD